MAKGGRAAEGPHEGRGRGARWRAAAAGALALAWAVMVTGWPPARAQTAPPGPLVILTSDDFPPYQFLGPDGVPMGFHVALARALCRELRTTCTLQTLPWEQLLPALAEGRGDLVLAGHRITPALKERFLVSRPLHRLPARFLVRRDQPEQALDRDALFGQAIAVVGGSRHEAYLQRFWPGAAPRAMGDLNDAVRALNRGEVLAVFGDGAGLARLLATENGLCCRFMGGPFFDAASFGEGPGFLVRQGRQPLFRALEGAIDRLRQSGAFARLMATHFPVAFEDEPALTPLSPAP